MNTVVNEASSAQVRAARASHRIDMFLRNGNDAFLRLGSVSRSTVYQMTWLHVMKGILAWPVDSLQNVSLQAVTSSPSTAQILVSNQILNLYHLLMADGDTVRACLMRVETSPKQRDILPLLLADFDC